MASIDVPVALLEVAEAPVEDRAANLDRRGEVGRPWEGDKAPVRLVVLVDAVLAESEDVVEERCSHCWTPCEAYPTILGNLALAAVSRGSRELQPAPVQTL